MRSVKERKTEGAPRERLYYSGTNHVWIIATICLYTTTRSILYSEVRLFFSFPFPNDGCKEQKTNTHAQKN